MTEIEPQPRDELETIDSERSRIVFTSALALAFLVVAYILLRPLPSAVVVVAIIVLVALKKAAATYQALGRTRAELMNPDRS